MTEMARPYKREEDKVIIDNIDSILDSRELRLEIQETLKNFTEAGKSLEVQMARAEKMLVQLNRRLEMTIQYIKTQNNNCIINNYYRKEDENESQVQHQECSSENANQ